MRRPVVPLRQVLVMGPAHQPYVPNNVRPAPAERLLMMKLEPAPLGTAPPVRRNEGASIAVALAHRTPDRRRDRAARRRGISRGNTRARPLCPGIATLLDCRQLLSDRDLDQHRQVAIWNLVPHRGGQSIQLFFQRVARRELNLVASRRQRLNDRRSGDGRRRGGRRGLGRRLGHSAWRGHRPRRRRRSK